MKPETISAVMDGLREAGIDFVVTLPSTGVAPLVPELMEDSGLKHVPVGNEGDGVVICAGAWLGGKKPALIIENTGVVVGAYALTGLDCMYAGMPILIIVDHRGGFGDGGGYFYFGGGQMAPVILEGLRIPYTIVRETRVLKAEIVRGQSTAEAYGKPVAVLLSGEDVW